MGNRVDDDPILTDCREAESAHPRGQDWRDLAEEIAHRTGLVVDWHGRGGGKGCIISGDLVIKTGQPWQISQSLECAKRLGEDYAAIIAHGGHWMVQERVTPIADAGPYSRAFRARGVTDTRHNCGTTHSGRVVAFDGFPLNQRPKV